MTTDCKSFTLHRALDATPERVFEVLVSPKARQIWGPPSGDMVVLIDEDQPEPAPGIRETSRCGPKDNPYVDVTTDWVLMAPGTRLVYAETLFAEEEALGVSLAVYDLQKTPKGTDLTLSVQVASFVGADMLGEFEGGWTHAFENIASFLASGS